MLNRYINSTVCFLTFISLLFHGCAALNMNSSSIMKNEMKKGKIEISDDDFFRLRNIDIVDAIYVGDNTISYSDVRPGYPLTTLEIVFSFIQYNTKDSVLTLVGHIADISSGDTSNQGRISFGTMPTTGLDSLKDRKVKIYNTFPVNSRGYFNIDYALTDSMILYISSWREENVNDVKELVFLSYVSVFNVYELVKKYQIEE